jgi:heme exporter protein C
LPSKTKIFDGVFFGLTFSAMLLCLYAIFIYAPIEKTMGVVQKIFYLHLPLAFLSFLAFLIVFIASILYLYKRDIRWDILAHSSAEVGVIFCSLVLITGPIWARPIWDVWWTWDPRLTTTLILWFMYVAYLMIRKLLPYGSQRSNIASVFGIISFINVPITFLVIRMWRSIHPVVIDTSGVHISAPMLTTLLISLGAFCLLFLLLLRTRIRLENTRHEYEKLCLLMKKKKLKPIVEE